MIQTLLCWYINNNEPPGFCDQVRVISETSFARKDLNFSKHFNRVFSSRSIVLPLANPLPSKIYLLKLLKLALNVVCPMRTSSSWKGLNLNLQHRQVGSALSLQNPSVCISCPTHNGLLFKTLVHLDQLNLIHSIYFIFLPFSNRFLRFLLQTCPPFQTTNFTWGSLPRKCLRRFPRLRVFKAPVVVRVLHLWTAEYPVPSSHTSRDNRSNGAKTVRGNKEYS